MTSPSLPKYLQPWPLEKLEQALATSKAAVNDCETEGLDWKRDKICGWVWGFGPHIEDTTYIPVRHKGNEGRGNYDPKKVVAAIRAGVKRNPNIRLKGFNLKFDLCFAAQDGLPIDDFHEDFEDGGINAFLIDEWQRSFSLDACAAYMGAQAKKGDDLYKHLAALFGGEASRKQMQHFHKLAADDFLGVDYAVGDSLSTWDLIDKQQPVLDEQDLRNIWGVECRTIRALTRMELKGVRVDEERLDQVRRLVQTRLLKAKSILPKDFNPRAPTQMKKLLLDNKVSMEHWRLTDKGAADHSNGKALKDCNFSFPEDWLLKFPIGQAVVNARKLENLESSFLGPLKERHLWRGRVHTTFNQTRGEEFGTVTGRLSSSNPNMQQVHKRNVLLGSLFRSIFIPDPGKEMAAADYEQIEPRLLAHFGEVQMLLDGYLSVPPIDAHSMVAMNAFGYDPKNKSTENKALRQYGKTLNQALITGSGNKAAAEQLGKSMAEAMPILESYFRSMPEIKAFQKDASNRWQRQGYLISLLGRRMRIDDPRFAYRAVNRILQTGNADVIKHSVERIDELFSKEYNGTDMLLNIHDDILYQYPKGDRMKLDQAIGIMQDYGPDDQTINLDVPLTVECKIGRDWAECSYGTEDVVNAFKEMDAKYEAKK